MKKLISLILTGLFACAFLGFTSKTATEDPWPVPDAYKNKVNPIKGDAASLVNGKALYVQHCKSCHGADGKGKGPKAAQLDTDPGDFTKAKFQSQTDGSLYYKTEKGRKDMPSYKTKIPVVNDMWAVVNYMRTFK